ncbi:hypothetical protein M430DRAFT_58789 [Amorphotheca resinae ATCC 22711]|uniref:Uncharacterized protein n=1 Tax=Amorphotheca resinae ATCC 22711 TaxID=857342 RepID=A0A2T3B278_AMORE|nr:hypothetical protein M430DRAFT_58789 [Amorphotheca resinae ATCC 22711]PSS18666.1 hypothetical protein M430DRAFT_58789 [Amorphotheca resinae ATCC 22711]
MAGFHWVNIDPSRASRRSVRTMDPVSSLGSVGPQEDGRPPGRSSPPLGHDNPRARFDGGSMRRGCADSDVGCEGRKILRNTAVYGVVCTEYGIRSALCALLLQQRTYIEGGAARQPMEGVRDTTRRIVCLLMEMLALLVGIGTSEELGARLLRSNTTEYYCTSTPWRLQPSFASGIYVPVWSKGRERQRQKERKRDDNTNSDVSIDLGLESAFLLFSMVNCLETQLSRLLAA